MKKLCTLLSVVLCVCLSLLTAKAQNIVYCNDTTPVQPFIFNFSALIGSDKNLCPLAGNDQDTLVCVPKGIIPSYSVTKATGVDVCLVANTSLCNDSLGGGPYDALSVMLRRVTTSDIQTLEISAMIKILYRSSSLPIQVNSNRTLYAPGSTVIVDMLYSRIGPADVCEVLDNGTVVSSQFTVRAVENEDCLMAVPGTLSELGAAQSLELSSPMPATEESRVNLFLISSNTVPCSSSTDSDRLSNVFSTNILKKPTPDPTPSPTPSPTPTPTEGLSTAVIAVAGTVGGIALIGIVVLVLVLVVVVVCICRQRQRNGRTQMGPTDYVVDRHNLSISLDSKPVSRQGPPGECVTELTETDSGFGRSPGPSTPVNYIVIVVYPDHRYYPLKSELGTAFGTGVKELILPTDPAEVDGFIRDLHDMLTKPHVKYAFFIHENSNAEHSESFQTLIQYFESRSCPKFLKVCDLRLGKEFPLMTNSIHRLGVTLTDKLPHQCAQSIYRQMSSYSMQHDEPALHATTSQRWDTTPGPPSTASPATDPMLKKTLDTLSKMNKKIDAVADNVVKIKGTGEATNETVQKIETAVGNINQNTAATRENTEDIIHRQDIQANPIVDEKTSDNEPSES